jgi:NhaP-type Na+/H+ or K+/H+ antiporter
VDSPLVYLTALFALGIAAQWLAWRLKLPAILLLLVFGFAARAFGGLDPDKVFAEDTLLAIVSLSVAVVLFDGGLTLRFSEIRETRGVIVRLVTIGSAVTWVLASLAALLVFDDWRLAVLTGAILVVTGPTVIIPLLRHVRPARRVGSVVKWEGIVIDPIGAILAVLVFESVAASAAPTAIREVVLVILKTVGVSAVFGLGAAALVVILLKRHWVPDYLHSPVLLAVLLTAFTASNAVQKESGLATVTVLGILMANQRYVTIRHLLEFKLNLGVVLTSVLFILLASRLDLERLRTVGWEGPVFLALLIFVVRPACVFFATLGTKLSWAERIFLGWMAPRGVVAAAVSSVFALELLELHRRGVEVAGSERLVPVMFLVIIGTVSVYGLSASWLAGRLGIADAEPQGLLIAGADPFVRDVAAVVQQEGFSVLLVDTNYENVRAARMAGLSTVHASIVSDYVADELDLAGIGRLLAMTSNEKVNSLGCVQFVEQFGRANLYQLAPEQRRGQKRMEVATPLKGRVLFGSDLSHSRLTGLVSDGFTIKTTRLTAEFDEASFRKRHGDAAVVLFVVREKGRLVICSADATTKLQTGDLLISLVPSQENATET